MSVTSRNVYLLILSLLLLKGTAMAQYSINTVPNPKLNGQEYFVSNPDGILNPYTVMTLDDISHKIDSLTGAEFAIVMVNNYIGESDFEFALELFNTWGIGKKEANNGLLLFISKNTREYRFISGYGMESIFPDAYLKRIGEKYLVPNFRSGNYDLGVLEAAEFIEHILMSPDSLRELERLMPEAMPFWSWRNPVLKNTLLILLFFSALYLYVHIVAYRILKNQKKKPKLIVPIFYGMGCMFFAMFVTLFIFLFVFDNLAEIYQKKNIPYFVLVLAILILAMKIIDGRSIINRGYKDEEDLQKALKKYVGYLFVPMLLTPVAWYGLFSAFNRFNNNKGRFTPPDDSGQWQRINRSSHGASKYLDKGQKKEEQVASLRYEIWKNQQSGVIKLIAWDKKRKFETCPECGYYTLVRNETRTLRAATYSATGQGETFDTCKNCTYFVSKGTFTIPKKERSSGSSSGGGSRGSSGSSGSFGGGSSGGGGAGGRW